MSDDIVERLREEGFITHMARLPRESKILHEAADEIERLSRRLLAEENAYDILRIENEHLQADRNNLALEVERLRKELDTRIAMCDMRSERIIELENIIDSSLDEIPSLQASIDSMSDEIAMLARERDEARREVCELEQSIGYDRKKDIAKQRGWDCFKENTNV